MPLRDMATTTATFGFIRYVRLAMRDRIGFTDVLIMTELSGERSASQLDKQSIQVWVVRH